MKLISPVIFAISFSMTFLFSFGQEAENRKLLAGSWKFLGLEYTRELPVERKTMNWLFLLIHLVITRFSGKQL